MSLDLNCFVMTFWNVVHVLGGVVLKKFVYFMLDQIAVRITRGNTLRTRKLDKDYREVQGFIYPEERGSSM